MAVNGQAAGYTGRVRQPQLDVGHGFADVQGAHRRADDAFERAGSDFLNESLVRGTIDRQLQSLTNGQGPRLNRLLETNGFVEEDLTGVVVKLDPGIGVAATDELPLLPVLEAAILGIPLLEQQTASDRQVACTSLKHLANLKIGPRTAHQTPPICDGRDGAALPPSKSDSPVITRAQ